MRDSGVFSELLFVEVTVDDLLEPVTCRLRGLAGAEVSVFSSGRARLRVGFPSPAIVDRGWSCGTVGVTTFYNHLVHKPRSSPWLVGRVVSTVESSSPLQNLSPIKTHRLLHHLRLQNRPWSKNPLRNSSRPARLGLRQAVKLPRTLDQPPQRLQLVLHPSPEQKDVIQSELNHVSSNVKDGLLLLRSPQCDAVLSRNRNPPRLGYQVLFLGGHCRQCRPFPLPLWSSPRLQLPKHLRILPWIPNRPSNPRDGERRSNPLRWCWMKMSTALRTNEARIRSQGEAERKARRWVECTIHKGLTDTTLTEKRSCYRSLGPERGLRPNPAE